ncbi:MAG: YafY family transcriptional regulator [Magnetovibrio sp.]|nr:YafY family transcriptional regulator [Magnetovibrio sp.]
MRVLRLFSILDRLRVNQHPVSAETLASMLDVSVRTIYRDMAALQSMGAPIRGESGVGYQMEKGYFLPPLHFDPDELDALTLGLQLVAIRGDKGLEKAAARASAKITSALQDGQQNAFQTSPLHAYHDPTGTQACMPLLGPVRVALRKRNKLFIAYKDLKDHHSTRTIRPLGLTVFEKAWLLTAWCEKRSDFRNFRVDRIKTMDKLPETFPREAGKEFSDFLKTLPNKS